MKYWKVERNRWHKNDVSANKGKHDESKWKTECSRTGNKGDNGSKEIKRVSCTLGSWGIIYLKERLAGKML